MTTKTPRPKQKSPHRSSQGNAPGRTADIIINGSVHLPSWVTTHDAFREWVFSSEFPDRGRFAYLAGKLWVDLSMETDLHNQIKTVITIILGSIVLNEALGRFYTDNMLLTHQGIGLSTEPDAMFVSNDRLANGLVKLASGDQSLEVSGSVDLALEVVSKSSVDKDTVRLVDLYARAGVGEYWLVDSTAAVPELVIMRLVGGKYVTARRHDGWVKSHVLARSFRLTCRKDADGLSHVNLETK